MTTDTRLDAQAVRRFVLEGYLLLEGLVPDSLNAEERQVPSGLSEALQQLVRQLVAEPAVSGAIRSLVGDYTFAGSSYCHVKDKPSHPIGWHSDERPSNEEGRLRLDRLWVLYYPGEVKLEDGPTMVLPGSHMRSIHNDALAVYDNILGQKSVVVPAGTLALCHPGIWHRTAGKLNHTPRRMIKFYATRQGQPAIHWRPSTEPLPDPIHRGYRPPYTNEDDYAIFTRRAPRLWRWLCGEQA